MDYQSKEGRRGSTDITRKPEGVSAMEQVRKHGSTWKIDEALQLLDEAAREKKEELGRLMTEKYSDIKEALNDATKSYREVVEKTKRSMNDTVTTGEEKMREITTGIDKRVHENPWLFFGVAAIGFFLSGFLLSGSFRSEMKHEY
ncbi:MAG: DUF883 domain-containing protein [wastewater metagenome]|nr:DUF883 domain-containing protein [Candidatus Loosdrechtia aerotolerans]